MRLWCSSSNLEMERRDIKQAHEQTNVEISLILSDSIQYGTLVTVAPLKHPSDLDGKQTLLV